MRNVYLFDLDSTITKAEILPTIAEGIGLYDRMRELTEKTMAGQIEFQESFSERVRLLSNMDVNEVAAKIAEMPLNENVVRFIQENRENCYVVTSNLDVWICELMKRIGIAEGHCYCSKAKIDGNFIVGIANIFNKEQVLDDFSGVNVIAIGDGSNDRGMLEASNIGIAFGGVRNIAPTLLEVADYVVPSDIKLYDLLHRIEYSNVDNTEGRTIIISCAGMGTRLGAGIPKALVDIDGKTLIQRHLEAFSDEDDVRIVVGFKAMDVIRSINQYTRDVIYVVNRDYASNGTGASVTLAKRFANQYIITIDGDLLIHPEDISAIVNTPGEYVGVSLPSTDDPVLTVVNDKKEVIAFSRAEGDFEWTGVSKTYVGNLADGDEHVCDILAMNLPTPYLLIRTKEVDTPNDLNAARNWVMNGFCE